MKRAASLVHSGIFFITKISPSWNPLLKCLHRTKGITVHTVDGSNSASVYMVNIPLLTRFCTFHIVQDFFHQQYYQTTRVLNLLSVKPHKSMYHQRFKTLNMTGGWFQTCFMFIPNLGEDAHFDEHMFQGGWFNHQLARFGWFLWFSCRNIYQSHGLKPPPSGCVFQPWTMKARRREPGFFGQKPGYTTDFRGPKMSPFKFL